MTYARVVGGVAVEVFIPPAGFTLAQCFPPATAALFILAPDGTVAGATLTGGVWSSGGPTLAQQLAAALAAGCQIVSTGTPALNGTYAADAETLLNLVGVETSLTAGQGFPPGGATTIAWFDASGAPHTFTAAAFTNFADAMRDFCFALDNATLPTQPATIA
jgi:hypothetical protein